MQSYRIQHEHELQLLRVTVEGEVTQALGEEIITQARRAAAEHGCGILYDMRSATVQIDLSRYFYLPRELEVLKTMPTRSVKVAIVGSKEQERQFRFYETVAGNVGLSVGVFLDEEEAVRWLR